MHTYQLFCLGDLGYTWLRAAPLVEEEGVRRCGFSSERFVLCREKLDSPITGMILLVFRPSVLQT